MLPRGLRGRGRQRFHRARDQQPIRLRDPRDGCKAPATLVAPLPARPVAVRQRDRAGPRPNFVLELT